MKKNYESPKMIVEQFEANEYIATCGDHNKVYKFECNSPRGTVYYYATSDGVIDGKYTGNGSAKKVGGYKPCGDTHESPYTIDVYYDGFVDRNNNNRCDKGEEAIIWLEWGTDWRTGQPEIDNWHATAELVMNEWDTAKS